MKKGGIRQKGKGKGKKGKDSKSGKSSDDDFDPSLCYGFGEMIGTYYFQVNFSLRAIMLLLGLGGGRHGCAMGGKCRRGTLAAKDPEFSPEAKAMIEEETAKMTPMENAIFMEAASSLELEDVWSAMEFTSGGGFGRGGEFNRKYANKLMQLRIAAQFVAVLIILAFVYFTSGG